GVLEVPSSNLGARLETASSQAVFRVISATPNARARLRMNMEPLVALLARPRGSPAVAGEVPLPAPVVVHHPDPVVASERDRPTVGRPTPRPCVLPAGAAPSSRGVDDGDEVVGADPDPPSVRRPSRGYPYPSVAGVGELGRHGMLRASVRV